MTSERTLITLVHAYCPCFLPPPLRRLLCKPGSKNGFAGNILVSRGEAVRRRGAEREGYYGIVAKVFGHVHSAQQF